MIGKESGQARRPFPGSVLFYRNAEERDAARAAIESQLNFDPLLVPDPQREIVRRLVETSGVAALMLANEPQVEQAIGDFLKGEKPAMLIAGHFGNGKSLLATDLRRMYEIYSSFGPSFAGCLAFLPWDRLRGDFYTSFRERMGMTPTDDLPKKMATPNVTCLITHAQLHHFAYMTNNFPEARVIVETPLFGGRGENVLEYARRMSIPHSVLVVHSPDMVMEIIERGRRDVNTSAHPVIMLEMQAQMMKMITGDSAINDLEKAMRMFANFFRNRLQQSEGLVVEWSPNIDREKFEQSRQDFNLRATTPDSLSPVPQRRLSDTFYQVTFDLMHADEFDTLVNNVTR